MSNASSEKSTGSHFPFNIFEPPANLPEPAKVLYHRAAGPVMIASAFCTHPERFSYPVDVLKTWGEPLHRAYYELSNWMVENEVRLRAEAPDVLSALQDILGAVEPVRRGLGILIGSLDARPANPNDPSLVAMVTAFMENFQKNHERHAHAILDGISVSWDVLIPLRDALSKWSRTLRADESTNAMRFLHNESANNGSSVSAIGSHGHKGKRINEKMLAMLIKNPECYEWTAEHFAEKLECRSSTVTGTDAWKNIMAVRTKRAVERTSRHGNTEKIDRRRHPKKKR